MAQFNTSAMSKPQRVAPPARARVGGSTGTADLVNAFESIVDERGDWFKIAENVPNYGRYYDGMRRLGAEVSITKVGVWYDEQETERPLYDIYAMVPEGEIAPIGSKAIKAEAKRQAKRR